MWQHLFNILENMSGFKDFLSNISAGASTASGVLGLFDSLFGISSSRQTKQMENQYKLNEMAADNAFKRQVSLSQLTNNMNRQNTIDNASMQRAGLQRAGLNPAMMAGGISGNVASASAPSAPQGSTSQAADQSMSNGINALSQMANGLIQAENINQLKSLRSEQEKNIQSDSVLKITRANMENYVRIYIAPKQAEYLQKEINNQDVRCHEMEANVYKLAEETNALKISNEFNISAYPLYLQKTTQEILNLKEQGKLTANQAMQALATVNMLNKQADYLVACKVMTIEQANWYKENAMNLAAIRTQQEFDNEIKKHIGTENFANYQKYMMRFNVENGFSNAQLGRMNTSYYVPKMLMGIVSGTISGGAGQTLNELQNDATPRTIITGFGGQ